MSKKTNFDFIAFMNDIMSKVTVIEEVKPLKKEDPKKEEPKKEEPKRDRGKITCCGITLIKDNINRHFESNTHKENLKRNHVITFI
jgi:hypothetical protein